MEVAVTGIGLRCALGDLDQSWQRLLKRESGISLLQPFPELPPYPLGLIGDKPIALSELTRLVIADVLKDAGLEEPLPDCGIAIGSSRAYQAEWETLYGQWHHDQFPESIDLRNIFPHQAAIFAKNYVGSEGLLHAPMAACATGLWAIAQGADLIRYHHCTRVLAGAVEAPVTPLTLAAFQKMGASAKTGCYPFDQKREGLVLGEGGAIFLLERADLAMARGAKIYGYLLGSGFTCDAHHISAPCTNNHSASIAIKQCLERSSLSPNAIDYIHPHGTGTLLNDQREAALLKLLFPSSIPVSSSKGATAHTLGASGALGSAFSLMAIKTQYLPPNVGLDHSAFELSLVHQARQQPIKHVLCLSFGFGGQNAVLCWGKERFFYDKC